MSSTKYPSLERFILAKEVAHYVHISINGLSNIVLEEINSKENLDKTKERLRFHLPYIVGLMLNKIVSLQGSNQFMNFEEETRRIYRTVLSSK